MDALTRRRMIMLAPLGVAAAVGGGFWGLLMRMEQGTYEPHALPSMLVGKPLPNFSLPGQPPSPGFSNSDVMSGKLPALVNFFASWCLPCIEEAPNLARLRELGVALWGIAYKDKTDATAAFLDQHGDPYLRVARDASGMTAINFGLYGVPETYVVDKTGIVRRRIAGGISQEMIRDNILPLLSSLG
jgi:cytochrome c biogenesis protein CcmG, thiol:disulfide interchange protein DsbE